VTVAVSGLPDAKLSLLKEVAGASSGDFLEILHSRQQAKSSQCSLKLIRLLSVFFPAPVVELE